MYMLSKRHYNEYICRLYGTKFLEMEKELGLDAGPGDTERRIILILESGEATLE